MTGFARIFLRLGAVSALNLDGGGSSVLMVNGSVVNRPSDEFRRVPTSWSCAVPRIPASHGCPRSVPDGGVRVPIQPEEVVTSGGR